MRNYPVSCNIPCTQNILLFLFAEWKLYKDEDYSKCEVCKINRRGYPYGFFRCNFNLHNKCASLPLTLESEVHDHPLTRIWKLMKFTCDLCGKAMCPFFVPNAISVFIKLVLLLIYASQSYTSQPPPPSHLFFSWSTSIWFLILSNLCSKSRHRLRVLLLFELWLCCPPWLCYGRKK